MAKGIFDWEDEEEKVEQPVVLADYQPESADETARRGGLAWSAGIVFFSSIVFMLFLGWGADLLLGSSPWGLVGGIVVGSIIGFIQFFRINSQIFTSKASGPATRPLMPRDDDE
jgi:F0F1-type ATP synthase assembly protein I